MTCSPRKLVFVWRYVCVTVFPEKGQTWPSACRAPASADGPQLQQRVELAVALLAQNAACAGKRRSGEMQIAIANKL